MNTILELKHNMAASLVTQPCTEEELFKRDFLKNYAIGNLQRLVMSLEKDAIYYKGDTMYVYKQWARNNLQEYELDI
jgi:hypothetical protein